MKYLVVGAGRMAVGVIFDLLNNRKTEVVHVTDFSENALAEMTIRLKDKRLKTHKINADDKEGMLDLMSEVNGVLSAVPYDYNLNLTKWAIDSNCHFVDLGGNNTVVNDQFELNSDAKNTGVGIVPDCGLAPGMVSVIVAHLVNQFESVESIEIRVGGLPLQPKTPLNYMLVFSPHGLINEYIEPTIILKDGEIATVATMTGLEKLEFPKPFGRLEAFYTSGGTSTLPQTYRQKVQHLDYKTIRYPGHCGLMKAMIDLGFTEHKEMKFKNQSINKREIFEQILSESLTFDAEDVVLIRVKSKGLIEKKEKIITYQAIEYGDKENNLTAMMRTTAFPAAIILQMLVEGKIIEKGVLRQEISIPPDAFIKELEDRNINFKDRS